MAVEGKTILQTTERTELTGKEGIPFQEGTQNGHVLVERLKEYVGEGLVKEDGLKTINGEKLTGIGDITIESDTGKPVILRYPKYNETSDDSTMLEKANSGEWFCTLPQMLENYNGGNLKAPFIGVQDDTNENFSPVTCYRIYSASNYYFMLYFLESNNNMEIQFRGFRMKYDPQDLTKWTGVFDNGTVRLSLASASNDGLMSKEDKEAFDNMKDGGAIEYKEISGQTVDADDLIVPKLTVRYLNKNASTAGNISNIPAKGGFVLESMCVRYVDKDNCGYIQRWVSQATDDNLLPYSYIRQYADGEWTEWRKEVDTYISVNEPFKKVGLYFNTSGFQVGNVSNSSVVKNGSFVISMGYTALHLTGIKNSTTYKVVSNASVGYWMMKTCPQQFFHAGKVAVSEDKTSESAETKKQYVAEVVSVNAEEETVTFSKTLNPYTDFNDYSAKFYAYVDKASFSLEAGTTFNYSISGTECVAGGDESGSCVAIGARCVSIEDNSVALCWQTVALNFAETALGISNKSHKGDSADKQTLFSIGNGTQYFNDWGTAKQKNAMEVMKNGDVYIEGVGGYDGINDGFTAQSVQDVISGLLSEVSALKEEIEALKGSGA